MVWSVERPDHPEFAGVAGLSRRGLDYRIVGEQQSGRDVIGAGELVSLLHSAWPRRGPDGPG